MSFQRRKVLRFLSQRGYRIIREGGEHTIVGDDAGRTASVPRHRHVKRNTARQIAKDLGLDLDSFLREIR
jgi:predicted RNA binding protein YcfA (HicA-like mRNA interferase family)